MKKSDPSGSEKGKKKKEEEEGNKASNLIFPLAYMFIAFPFLHCSVLADIFTLSKQQ